MEGRGQTARLVKGIRANRRWSGEADQRDETRRVNHVLRVKTPKRGTE